MCTRLLLCNIARFRAPLCCLGMALLAPGSVLWQTTSWSHYNWNDFPPELNRDTEQRFQAWLGTDNDPQWLEFPYIYGWTGVSYIINFDRMEQQRVGVRVDDPPRPIRRVVVTHATVGRQ